MCDEDKAIDELETEVDMTEEDMDNAMEEEEILATYRGYHQIGAGHDVDLRIAFTGTVEDIYSVIKVVAEKAYKGLSSMAKEDDQIRCNLQIQTDDFGSVFSLEKGGVVSDYPEVMTEMAKKIEMITESEVIIPMIDDDEEDKDGEGVCEDCKFDPASKK